MKKIITLVLVMLMMTNMVFAETPVLISAKLTEEYAGFVVSYEDQTLVLEVEETYMVFEDPDNVMNLTSLKAKDHVRIEVVEKEGAKVLLQMIGYSPIMYVQPNLFTVTKDGDRFELEFSENPSTGYTWQYQIKNHDHVTYVSDNYTSNSDLLGAPGQRTFTFEVNERGVSTISFKNVRGDGSVSDSVDVLVYKTEDKLFVEADQVMSIASGQIMDGQTSYDTIGLQVNNQALDLKVMPVKENGVVMLPLAETLRALDFQVDWYSETQTIEISKGPQWTSITLGENAYFKNKMAPSPLSAPPMIMDGRTMVPAEFFHVILGLGIQVESSNFKITDQENMTYSGYIKNITYDETGMKTYHLGYDADTDTIDIVIHTSNAYTFVQKDFEIGQKVNAITSMVTTRSIPAQTSGYIIY